MCCCGGRQFNTPNGGIPLVPELFAKLPKEVQGAFNLFQEWWENQEEPRRSEMPKNVMEAYEIIQKAELPGYNGLTCGSCCSIIGVERIFEQNEL